MRILLSFLVFLAAGLSTAGADPTPAWRWDDVTPDLFPRADLEASRDGVTYVLSLRDRNDGKHDLRLDIGAQSVTLAGDNADELTGAALAVDAAHVYVAVYNKIATGCRLVAYRTSDGALAWSVELTGAGPVSHSKYRNRVQLAIVDGKPTVFGDESAARYVESRDPTTGKLVSNAQLPSQIPDRPIAESLFVELDSMLAKQQVYRVDVNDFLARHVRMKDADHAARAAAFRAAAKALDGTRLQHGRWKMTVVLVDSAKTFQIEARRQ